MQYKKISAFLLACTTLLASSQLFAEDDVSVQAEVKVEPVASEQAGEKRPAAVNFSARYKKFTLKKAYSLQKAYVKNRVARGVVVSGFKAGFTGAGAPEKYGLSEPITGVLTEAPLFGNQIELSLDEAHMLMLEMELAYRVSEAISEPLTMEQLKERIGGVAPAIELPDLSFPDMKFTGLDVVANNALAYKSIVGKWHPASTDVDAIEVSLSCGGEKLAEGKGSNSMGAQWEALLWMVNNLVDQGYSIKPGQILLTGTLIPMIPAEICTYTADFGELGSLEFTVK